MSCRTCPACARRYAGLVDPDCVVCDGVGVLALHPVALHRSDPAVIARAVELYLEAGARQAATGDEPATYGLERTNALAAAVDQLRLARVIDNPPGVPTSGPSYVPEGVERRAYDSDAFRAAAHLGVIPRGVDAANLDAAPVVYDADARPRATGLLPQVSAAGHQGFLARAADPTDALGPDTRAEVYARQATDRAAHAVAAAVDPAASLRARQTRRA